MTMANTLSTGLLRDNLRRLLRDQPDNVAALCHVGGELAQAGHTDELRKCYRAAVDALRRAAHRGNADQALDYELMIYETFVKIVEDEQHYYRCFSAWKDELAALGRRFRKPEVGSKVDANRIAFVLHTGHMLGHTEVLLKLLESRPPEYAERLQLRVYILEAYDQQFVQRCRAAQVEVILVTDTMPNGATAPWGKVLTWLSERLTADGVGICIWVAVPVHAAFALAMRLAPVQIFWSLRFHPISGPYIDGYITYGAKHEHERMFGKQKWKVCPVPLAIDSTSVDAAAKTELRARFTEKFLLGTLAREEKINSTPFLESVARILQQNPAAGFVWTGKTLHPGIERHFDDAGVISRCHFVGWVDTRLYASALDLFLETFPLGCGITGYQALGAGTPLLSYFAANTVFGMQFWHEFAGPGSAASASVRAGREELAKYPVLCAKDADDYVALANRVVADPAFKASVSAIGKQFFDKEIGNAGYYSVRFFDTIAEIAKTKFAARPDAAAIP